MQRLPSASVLIVDDMPANLLALQTLLRPLGHEIVTAQSGVEALELAAEREFAVVLLDVMMPVLDGIGTLERLRTLPRAKSTPVILLTAYQPERQLMERAYALGALDFVEKPVAIEVLRAKVSSFVALYQQGQEIRRQADELRAKDRHLGVLAHDLRTPLSVIVTSAERLRVGSDDKGKQCGERIGRAARRMERLIEDLLEFARASAGHFVLKREHGDLCALCCEMVHDVGDLFPQVSFTRDLPAELIGDWDPARLEQAVANLIVNGAKYGTGWVSLRLTRSQGMAELTVANGGEVIAAERLSQLFAPFVRGEVGADGLGLGLYVAREVARAHGGELHAESDARSTRFIMRLPLVERAGVGDAAVERGR